MTGFQGLHASIMSLDFGQLGSDAYTALSLLAAMGAAVFAGVIVQPLVLAWMRRSTLHRTLDARAKSERGGLRLAGVMAYGSVFVFCAAATVAVLASIPGLGIKGEPSRQMQAFFERVAPNMAALHRPAFSGMMDYDSPEAGKASQAPVHADPVTGLMISTTALVDTNTLAADAPAADSRKPLEPYEALGLTSDEPLADAHDPAKWFAKARAAERAGDLDKARLAYERTLNEALNQRTPTWEARALNGVGRIQYLLGDLDAAKAAHDKALDLNLSLQRELGIASSLFNLELVDRRIEELSMACAGEDSGATLEAPGVHDGARAQTSSACAVRKEAPSDAMTADDILTMERDHLLAALSEQADPDIHDIDAYLAEVDASYSDWQNGAASTPLGKSGGKIMQVLGFTPADGSAGHWTPPADTVRGEKTTSPAPVTRRDMADELDNEMRDALDGQPAADEAPASSPASRNDGHDEARVVGSGFTEASFGQIEAASRDGKTVKLPEFKRPVEHFTVINDPLVDQGWVVPAAPEKKN